MVVHACDPRTLEVKARGSEVQGHLWILNKLQSSKSYKHNLMYTNKAVFSTFWRVLTGLLICCCLLLAPQSDHAVSDNKGKVEVHEIQVHLLIKIINMHIGSRQESMRYYHTISLNLINSSAQQNNQV